MMTTNRSECVYYLEPVGRRNAVRRVCTCGQSHGARTWRDTDRALESGELAPNDVAQWATHPSVGPTSRILAKRHNAVARAWASWRHA